MKTKKTIHSSYRQMQKKLKRNFQLKIWILIVLSRFMYLLALFLTYYHERF